MPYWIERVRLSYGQQIGSCTEIICTDDAGFMRPGKAEKGAAATAAALSSALYRSQIPFEGSSPEDEAVSITGPESERILSGISCRLQRRKEMEKRTYDI